MSEQDMRGRVIRALSNVHAIAVENPVLPGTPDINYIGGWIETKWLRNWPVNEDTLVRIEHFTPQQRVWHIKRRLAGGTSWVLLQCKRDWILLDGAVAAIHLNQCDRATLYELAIRRADGFPEGLVGWICQEQSEFSLNGEDGERLRKMLRAGTGSLSPFMSSGKEVL